MFYISVFRDFSLADPFWLRKMKDVHILAHVNMECPDDRYPKLQTYLRNDFRQILLDASSIRSTIDIN